MATDVERIAEVLADHRSSVLPPHLTVVRCTGCDWTNEVPMTESAKLAFRIHLAEQLAAAGFGHVPTALHQAADEVETALPINCELLPDGREDPRGGGYVEAHGDIGQMLRARADRAGGDHV